MTEIKVGQVWESNDPRLKLHARMLSRFRIVTVTVEYVTVENVTGPKRRRQIRTQRLRPTNTGYRFVSAS